MKTRSLLLSIALIVLILPVSTTEASIWLVDYVGYDYIGPLSSRQEGREEQYVALGVIPSANPDFLVLDPGKNEYTFRITSGTQTDADTLGTYAIYNYNAGDGTIGLYEDQVIGGTDYEYGSYPPNTTAPSTFVDGSTILSGSFTSMTILVDLVSGDASLNGNLLISYRSRSLNLPPDMLEGWTFAGMGSGMPGTPDGWLWQIDGEIYIPDPIGTESTSWGEVKKLFR